MISKSTKLSVTIAFTSFASALFFYTLTGLPMPRPVLFFVLLAGSVTSLVLGGFFTNSRYGWYALSTTTLIIGYGLRLSGFLSVVASGIDHGRWMYRAKWATEIGKVLGNDMYQASPIYIIELAQSNLLLGGPITSVRHVTIFIGAILPLLFFMLAYRVGGNLRVGFFALLFAATQPFFLRTSTLMESESMALPWLVLSIYFFTRSYQDSDLRFNVLFSIILITSVMLHFFYGIVIISTFSGACVLYYFKCKIVRKKSLQTNINSVWVGVLAALVFAPTWILWSTYAGTAGVTLASAFSIPDYTSIIQILIPSSGSVAQGSGSGGSGSSGSIINTLGKFYPVITVFAIGAIGGLYAIFRSHKRYFVLILLTVPVGSLTILSSDPVSRPTSIVTWHPMLAENPANYEGQTQADDPAYSDRAVRGKRTTGAQVCRRTKPHGPRPISSTVGRGTGSTVAPVSRLPANYGREMQPTAGRVES
ncbi:ArnT family glycosyltransferase [Halorubrum miltondacostae]|uniref:ArnT family glycosyltransferase n=1 Tax=Halorubrum miltondacostae TaxID=3076378 RepID=UPI003528A506